MDDNSIIIRDMSDGILKINGKGKITCINPAAKQLLDINSDETISNSFAELFIGNKKTIILFSPYWMHFIQIRFPKTKF